MFLMLLFFCSTTLLFAQVPVSELPKPEPLVDLQGDSIFIEIENEQYYAIHQRKKGESLYKIARFYAVHVNDIYINNPSYGPGNTEIALRIPIRPRMLRRHPPTAQEQSNYYPVFYRVKPSEGLYRIARVYFNMPVEVLKERNGLKSNNLKINQVLHTAWFHRMGVSEDLRKAPFVLTGVLGKQNDKFKAKYEAKKGDAEEFMYQGVASWPKGQKLSDQTSVYVLYSGRKVGSIVRVENPMTNRFVYAEVIAPLPDAARDAEHLIMLSPALAHALGGLDKVFHVKVYHPKN